MLDDLIAVSRHSHSGVGRICEVFLAKWYFIWKDKDSNLLQGGH